MSNDRRLTGALGHAAGQAAEARIAADYESRGYPVCAVRWRGTAGELDLVARDGAGLIFVEVKKSRSFDRALERLSQRQINRIFATAEEYAAQLPTGSLTDMRFDVALMNDRGEIRILENALMA